MKDFVGTILEVGDEVVYSRILGSKLVMEKVEVLGFTDTKVKVTALSCYDDRRGYSLCNPDRLVVVGKVVAF
jgi:hypothetical protein